MGRAKEREVLLLVGVGLPFPSPTRKEGVLLPVGVGLPMARPLLGRLPLPPCSFIYGGRGAPLEITIDLLIS